MNVMLSKVSTDVVKTQWSFLQDQVNRKIKATCHIEAIRFPRTYTNQKPWEGSFNLSGVTIDCSSVKDLWRGAPERAPKKRPPPPRTIHAACMQEPGDSYVAVDPKVRVRKFI